MKQGLVNVVLKLVNLKWEGGCYRRPSSHSSLTGSFDLSQSHLTPRTIQPFLFTPALCEQRTPSWGDRGDLFLISLCLHL